jgi:hypothetical protein
MTSDQITGILRAILAALGGFILAKGWVSAETWAWLTGGILTVGGAVWSLWSNRPAGIAGSAQTLPGVNVQTTPAATPAVITAVANAKAAA